jgi:hypothetical protein
MKTVFFILVLATSTNVFGQESMIYRRDGKLKLDTIYSIDSKRLKDFETIEKDLLPIIFNKLLYPNTSKSSVSGIVIAKLKLDQNNNLSIHIVKSADESLSSSVKIALDTSLIKHKLLSFKKPFEFYIPFQFEVLKDTFLEDLKLHNSIVIRSSAGTRYNETISTKDNNKN